MLPSWIFRCYVDHAGVDVIDQWYKAQSAAVQAKFDTRIKFLRHARREQWQRPGFDTYSKGIGEIRMEVANVQYRVFGCPFEEYQYVWLMAATKKGSSYSPSRADKTALERKELIAKGKGEHRVCDFE